MGDLTPLVEGRSIGREDHVAVENQPAGSLLPDLVRSIGRQADHVAVALDDGGRHTFLESKARLLTHMAHLAMHRHQDLRPDPAVHGGQFRTTRVA